MQTSHEKPNIELSEEVKETLKKVGIEKDKTRAASYMLSNNSLWMNYVNKGFEGKMEIMDIKDAIKKYSWVRDYCWKAVDFNKDEFTKKVYENTDGGYFIRVFENANINLPIQSCLMISSNDFTQKIHNLIIIEKGATANIISGCVLHPHVKKGTHIGISEFFIKEGAKLNFTMIHNWSEETTVRPRSAAIIDKNATFISNYVCFKPVKDIQMYPVAKCDDNSKAVFNSLLFGKKNSLIDSGAKIELNGVDSKAEIVSRVIASESSTIISRGLVVGNNKSKGHLECKGILIGNKSKIHAIPELLSNNPESNLFHEASVGKIAEAEISYLMSRGLPKEEAISMIIRGFMDVSILGLPKELNKSIELVMEKVSDGL